MTLFFLAGLLHLAAALALSLGVLFLLFWCFKTLSPKLLWKWGWILAISGFVVCLITFGAFRMHGAPGQHGMMMKKGMMEWDRGMMMDEKDMGMNGMVESLKGKTGDDFDTAFINAMIPHHQGAIDMAKLAQQSAKHVEIKNMAKAIITAQQKEIDQMKQWQKSWGYAQ